jgi:hypothetical protein
MDGKDSGSEGELKLKLHSVEERFGFCKDFAQL